MFIKPFNIFLLESSLQDFNKNEYNSWKRKNVTLRGIKEFGKENNVHGMLGKGLYTAFLSNSKMAKSYGEIYFVVNAIPKNPLIFKTLNVWEIWFQNLVYKTYKNGDFPDEREFRKNTTIESEIQKLGYDGVIISGREMVNYKPKDILYFKSELTLIEYFKRNIKQNTY